MNADKFKKKISNDREVEEKIFKKGSKLFCSCAAYDVVAEAAMKESLGATEMFYDFIHALIKAGEEKNFIARDNALRRLVPKE